MPTPMRGTNRVGSGIASSMSIFNSGQGKSPRVINNLSGNIKKIRLDTLLCKDFDGDVLVRMARFQAVVIGQLVICNVGKDMQVLEVIRVLLGEQGWSGVVGGTDVNSIGIIGQYLQKAVGARLALSRIGTAEDFIHQRQAELLFGHVTDSFHQFDGPDRFSLES